MKYLLISVLFSILMSTDYYCQCFMSNFTANITSCDPWTNTFSSNGSVEFMNAPSSGTLNIEINNGSTTYDTIINVPFVSPISWSISNIPSDGSSLVISAYFSTNTSCSISLNSNAPADCSCSAEAGTYTSTQFGSSSLSGFLSFGDTLMVTPNTGFVPPSDQNLGSFVTYDPGIAYLYYTCTPTNPIPYSSLYDNFGSPLDSCLMGMISFGDTLSTVNSLGMPNYGVNYSNNTIYFAPITMYSLVDYIYAVSTGGDFYCYDLGAPIEVTYLPEIQASAVMDSIIGEVTITVTGGYPEIFNGTYTIANIGAGTLSSTTVDSTGGSFSISDLTGGSIWNVSIQDTTGTTIELSDTLPGTLNINHHYSSYSVYPNPFEHSIQLIGDSNSPSEIMIYSMDGKLVFADQLANNKLTTFNLSMLPKGVYLLEIRDSYSNQFKRIIKE